MTYKCMSTHAPSEFEARIQLGSPFLSVCPSFMMIKVSCSIFVSDESCAGVARLTEAPPSSFSSSRLLS